MKIETLLPEFRIYGVLIPQGHREPPTINQKANNQQSK
ncbi:unnamed protein product, partial [Vitis vinifera]